MGYAQEYRNGYYGKSMIENADLAESVDMIGVVTGPSSMRVLNNRSYSSSPRFYHFAKYRTPIKEPTRRRRNLFDRLTVLNLEAEKNMYDSVNDSTHNSPTVRKSWQNTRSFIEYVSRVSDENLFL